jgi:high-affinity iron transporter
MLPTFVIGLREGLEAALIVGIVAAFLRQRGRKDLLRWAFAGVVAAIVLCLAVGIALDIVSHELPQKKQEGLETVIGAVAVVMVTYMVVWMRRHARTLKGQLEDAAGVALAAGSGFALVLMAFLAVLREGLETVVFLLAAFNQSGNPGLAATGALLGIVLAILLGWGIYRGGVQLNLSKFFRLTGIVLTFVAAGLVVSALHTAHEAGWLNIGQQATVDLSALVTPGSVQAALLTGMLGVQAHPVLIEVIGWLAYLIPVGIYVGWPAGRGLSSTATRRVLAITGALAAVVAIVLAVVLPDAPARHPVTRAPNGATAQAVSIAADGGVIAVSVVHPAQSSTVGTVGTVVQLPVSAQGAEDRLGVATRHFHAQLDGAVTGSPTTMTLADLAERNGGRLPLGANRNDGTLAVPVRTTAVDTVDFWISPTADRIIDLTWRETVTLTATFTIGPTVIGEPTTATWQLPADVASVAARAARADQSSASDRSLVAGAAGAAALLALACGVALAALTLSSRRDRSRDGANDASGVQPVTIQAELSRS